MAALDAFYNFRTLLPVDGSAATWKRSPARGWEQRERVEAAEVQEATRARREKAAHAPLVALPPSRSSNGTANPTECRVRPLRQLVQLVAKTLKISDEDHAAKLQIRSIRSAS